MILQRIGQLKWFSELRAQTKTVVTVFHEGDDRLRRPCFGAIESRPQGIPHTRADAASAPPSGPRPNGIPLTVLGHGLGPIGAGSIVEAPA
jgi:hypothetical protein